MSHYQIRVAQDGDLPDILEIYTFAREFMCRNGNPTQWGDGYPRMELLQEDIRKGALHVVTNQDGIHGVFYFAVEDDPTYDLIEAGAWISNTPYGVIHRIASDGSGGIFTAALRYTLSRTAHLRIDTHQDNKPMQHVVEKHGFQRCGIIYVADGTPRIAYEKV